MASKSARHTAKIKAKQRKRAARRQGILKKNRPGGRLKGAVTKARHN